MQTRTKILIVAAAVTVPLIFGARMATTQRTPPGQAPPHNRPIVKKDGKTLLWAKGDPKSDDAEWFDVTDALIDPRNFQYGIGKDRIPSIDNPVFVKPDDARAAAARISDTTRVFGYAAEGEAKAYPISIMDRHEIVNDKFGEKPIAIGW